MVRRKGRNVGVLLGENRTDRKRKKEEEEKRKQTEAELEKAKKGLKTMEERDIRGGGIVYITAMFAVIKNLTEDGHMRGRWVTRVRELPEQPSMLDWKEAFNEEGEETTYGSNRMGWRDENAGVLGK